jgi:predicted dehydrogenase
MNIALVGSNFGIKGYLPAIKKIKNVKLKIICSRNIKKLKNYDLKNIIHVTDWKKIFKDNIRIVILAVPPKLQEKIITYNLKYKKRIIFEKPISSSYFRSKKLVERIKKKKIKAEVNLTYLNHDLFKKLKYIIDKQILGPTIDFKINWNFISHDLNKKIKSWKTNEKLGGGIKNIFLTHVFSYCQFFFGNLTLRDYSTKIVKFKGLNFKNKIFCNVVNQNHLNGKILINTKKNGLQSHKIKINFKNGHVKLFTKSKDWTKDFTLEVNNKNSKKIKIYKSMNKKLFIDGRSYQIHAMIKDFLKKPNYKNLDFCLSSEKINNTLI